jgi:serine/threonine protein kinase
MEYVKGTTLLQFVREARIAGPEHALELTVGVLEALDHAHRHGIVHRDIKPANVMLSHEGIVKVTDFGIARSVDRTGTTLTRTSVVVGTAEYLSPEQARGEQVDVRTDLYSTGCLLYELLTRRPPFTGDTPLAVAMKHLSELPVPPSAHAPQLPAAYDTLVLRALAKDRADRYQTAEEMRDAIGKVLAGRATAVTSPLPDSPATVRHTKMASPLDPRKERSVRRRRISRRLLAMAVLLAVGVCVSVIAGSHTPARSRLAAPSLIGDSMTEARSNAQAVGVRVQPIRHRVCPHPGTPIGRVCDQTPLPGSEVPRHAILRVTLSPGTPHQR